MKQRSHNQSNKRKEKSSQKIARKNAELVLEAERVGQGLVCRRVGIILSQLPRWKQKFHTEVSQA